VRLTTFNSRMKDFYDIFFMAHEGDFEGNSLQQAIKNTFERRQTRLTSARKIIDSDFGSQPKFQQRWVAFRKRTKFTDPADFKTVFEKIRIFLKPVIDAELEEITLNRIWNKEAQEWQSRAT
jgi:hypothetical protein